MTIHFGSSFLTPFSAKRSFSTATGHIAPYPAHLDYLRYGDISSGIVSCDSIPWPWHMYESATQIRKAQRLQQEQQSRTKVARVPQTTLRFQMRTRLHKKPLLCSRVRIWNRNVRRSSHAVVHQQRTALSTPPKREAQFHQRSRAEEPTKSNSAFALAYPRQ